jgi:hypothetical protein
MIRLKKEWADRLGLDGVAIAMAIGLVLGMVTLTFLITLARSGGST